jgi:hypothetical protein
MGSAVISATDGNEQSASSPSRLKPSNHWIGGSVDPRAHLNYVRRRNEPFAPTEKSNQSTKRVVSMV